MNKVHKITLTIIAACFVFSTAFAANLPKNCTDEIMDLSKKNGFDIQKFMKDLPPAVVKAKLQAKAPFGKPKDSDKTDIGMTFGCLKVFPESPSEIQFLLKDVSLKIGTDLAANKLGVAKPASNAISPVASISSAATPVKASAAQQNVIVNVAVIETKVDAEPAVVKEFKPSELRYMTQEIRRQTINNLPRTKFSIIAEEQQDSVVSQKCTDKNCWMNLGKKINADFIIRGIIGKFRKNYTFHVEIYDVGNGILLLSSDPVESEKAEELLSGFRGIAPAFFKRFEGELSGFRKTAPAPSKQAPSNSNTACKTEVGKARSIYDECVKMGKASSGYTKCAEDYKNQKEKAEQVCNISNSVASPQSTFNYNSGVSPQSSNSGASIKDCVVQGIFDNGNKFCHEGKIYKTVKMPDGKIWFTENMNYAVRTSLCYQNNESNCQKCGRLYDWATAKTICPGGWHLPTDAEWTALEDAIGGYSTAGTILKSKNGWNDKGNGIDRYGFSVLPCGYQDGGSFGYWGSNAAFWSATETGGEKALRRYLYASDEDAERETGYQSDFYSVRCLQD